MSWLRSAWPFVAGILLCEGAGQPRVQVALGVFAAQLLLNGVW